MPFRTYDSHMGRQRIYVNERGDCVVNDTGFSWFAAFFSPVWALQKRLYLVALALLKLRLRIVGPDLRAQVIFDQLLRLLDSSDLARLRSAVDPKAQPAPQRAQLDGSRSFRNQFASPPMAATHASPFAPEPGF